MVDDSNDSTIGRLDSALLGGPRTLVLADLAERAGASLKQARAFWLSLGLPVAEAADPSQPAFTEADAVALARAMSLIQEHGVAEQTVVSLTRALGQTCDRLSLWQMEALVEDIAERYALDDVSARLVVLDRLEDIGPILEAQLVHAWRRQMAAISGRYSVEFSQARAADTPPEGSLPLVRAMGYADMVDYTRRTAGISSKGLASLVRRFENAVRDVVISTGGRVVKTIGDAVMFVADVPDVAATIALGLTREMSAAADLPDVRVSMCYGRVLSRCGDVYETKTNIAARLNEIAGPGKVLTDEPTSAHLRGDDRFILTRQPEREFIGIGQVTPVLLESALG